MKSATVWLGVVPFSENAFATAIFMAAVSGLPCVSRAKAAEPIVSEAAMTVRIVDFVIMNGFLLINSGDGHSESPCCKIIVYRDYVANIHI